MELRHQHLDAWYQQYATHRGMPYLHKNHTDTQVKIYDFSQYKHPSNFRAEDKQVNKETNYL